MASQYERQADGTCVSVHTTFAQRKAARLANAGKKFSFNVVTGFPFSGEIVGSFSSRAAAEKFAFEQRGPMAGNTAAMQEVFDKHHKTARVPTSLVFTIERV